MSTRDGIIKTKKNQRRCVECGEIISNKETLEGLDAGMGEGHMIPNTGNICWTCQMVNQEAERGD